MTAKTQNKLTNKQTTETMKKVISKNIHIQNNKLILDNFL